MSDQLERFKCRICLGETNHRVLYSRSIRRTIPYDQQEAEQYGPSYDEDDHYTLLQCCGCDDIRLRVISEAELHGQSFATRAVYPADQVRHMPEWVYGELYVGPNLFAKPEQTSGRRELLADIRSYLREIHNALGTGSNRLAMMGMRALVERIMIEEVGDRHGFEKNIKAFFDKGFVAPAQQEMFRSHIEAGHAVMHRGWAPSRDDVMTVLDILESLIKTLYVDSKKAMAVAAKIPPRVPRIPMRKAKDD